MFSLSGDGIDTWLSETEQWNLQTEVAATLPYVLYNNKKTEPHESRA